MHSETKQPPIPNTSSTLREWLDLESGNHVTWNLAQSVLGDIAESAGAADLRELEECVQLLGNLLKIVETQTPESSAPSSDVKEILSFLNSATPTVVATAEGNALVSPTLHDLMDQARDRWGDCLQLVGALEPNELGDDCHLETSSAEFPPDEMCESPATSRKNTAEQIQLLLSAIAECEKEATQSVDEPQSAKKANATFDPAMESNSMSEMCADADLRDAFLQDAGRCLAALEQSLLELESNPRNSEHYRQICRELHTLKGAAASVGLAELTNYLHEVEETIERHTANNEPLDIEVLLSTVDSVRRNVGAVESIAAAPASIPRAAPSSAEPSTSAVTAPSITTEVQDGSNPSSVRVRSSKLDRLMDMLAELVVLRNRRETQITELNLLNQEVVYCAARLKQYSEQLCDVSKSLPHVANTSDVAGGQESGIAHLGLELANSKAIAEVASDLSEISRGIRDFYRPIGEENVALTHFIRQFRREMMQLRRLPVSGLFQRLQRAARDAARAEAKQVQVQFVGHQTAIEQSLQELLYEPLLHIVRNAVSHGIEDAATRAQRGKPAVGHITLQISASANLLSIHVSDDGRGLDYDALRRRGYECGLISPERSPTLQELAKLIFHPGFSTRDSASEISGRGVGMDIVATAIDRLHGRIEVDSSQGQGTTIRLSIPLRSGIEHAMVFRSGGQLFAVPMQSVSAAQNTVPRNEQNGLSADQHAQDPCVSFARAARLPTGENHADRKLLVLDLDLGNRGAFKRINLLVDEIVGGEEVVVRALPRSLKQHPFASGVTLSGGGAMVLTIDPIRLGELCRPYFAASASDERIDYVANSLPSNSKKVLVVDDSLSARMSLVKRLKRHGLEIVEACDGMQALDCLRCDTFELVVTDIDMPRMGGLELLSEIRQRRLLDIPVVVVSSRTEESLRQRAKHFGVEAYLNKPVSDESLTELLQQLSLIAS